MESTKGNLKAENVANTLLAQGYKAVPKRDEQ